MRMRLAAAAVTVFALSLGACEDSAPDTPTTSDRADVQGEVQGGTASDAMLPLDRVSSKSPAMKPAPGEGRSSSDDADSSDDEESASEDPAPEAAPAEPSEPAEED